MKAAEVRLRYTETGWEAPFSKETNLDRIFDALEREIGFEDTIFPETDFIDLNRKKKNSSVWRKIRCWKKSWV